MFDLSVQTIVLVTVTSCEIHVKKLVHIFTFDVTLYLGNGGFFINTSLKNLHTKGCVPVFTEFLN